MFKNKKKKKNLKNRCYSIVMSDRAYDKIKRANQDLERYMSVIEEASLSMQEAMTNFGIAFKNIRKQ